MKTTKKYSVIRDTREKTEQGWFFYKTDKCAGMKTQKLEVGEYTLEGFEYIFTIERKGAISEFAANLAKHSTRFYKEMERGSHLKHIWLVLEFDMGKFLKYPKIPEIPRAAANMIRFKGYAALSKTLELQVKFPNVHVLFVGEDDGLSVAGSIFKRMVEQYGKVVDSKDSTDS